MSDMMLSRLRNTFIWSAACLCVALMLMGLGACRHTDVADVAVIDSLNMMSYHTRYISASESKRYADEVIARYGNSGYVDGVHVAWLNKAFAHYMLMEYDSVRVCCDEVMEHSRNDIMRALADVHMMFTSNMVGQSKEFYTYRSDAKARLSHVGDELDDMSDSERRAYYSAMTQFHIASLRYFTRMRLTDEVNESKEWLDQNVSLYADDPSLTATHLMLRSLLALSDDHGTDVVTLQRRELANMLQIANEYGFTYMKAEAMHRLSRSIARNGALRPVMTSYLTDMLGVENEDSLGILLAEHALRLFEQYGNRYSTGQVLITLSDYKLQSGEYDDAISLLNRSLQLINEHYRLTSVANGAPQEELPLYGDVTDSVSTDVAWITSPDIKVVTTWMLSLREQLSVVYGAMGWKAASDYNHNVYFDILDATRQDKRVEQEGEKLKREERMLDVLIVAFCVVLVLMAWVIYVFNRRSAKRYQEHVAKLSEVVGVCKRMTGALSEDMEDEDDLLQTLHSLTDTDVARLFPKVDQGDDWTKADIAGLSDIEREMYNVLCVCFDWMKDKGLMFISFVNEEHKLESETYALEKKYEESKKQYLEKLTSMSIVNGITPFLDRALREVDKLKHETGSTKIEERLKYVCELIDKINEYNDVLGHWVKIRQGVINLSIENFALQPLLDTMKLNTKAFDAKSITLSVGDSDSVVKADKSLTLFMINTLLDNARKYTPAGGTVSLTTEMLDDCVEIAVQDSGHGMSADDVATINGSKVYDSSRIGTTGAHADEVKQQKGFGFGLMNCKGIIEKYRKTNAVFSVCQFGVQSEEGRGCRFFFRLPKGVMKAMSVLVMLALMSLPLASCLDSDAPVEMPKVDRQDRDAAWANDELMLQAQYYAECQLYANVQGEYEEAIEYADSAIVMLNAYYLKQCPDGELLINLYGGPMVEADLWRDGFDTDYDLIIGIRNEVAISALALNRNNLYRYNSESFKRLYTLANTDNTLEQYCNDLRSANMNRKALAGMLGLVILAVMLVYFFMHYRRHMLLVLNMRQFIALNKQMFATESKLLPQVLRQGISDIKLADDVRLLLNAQPDSATSTAPSFAVDDYSLYPLDISTADGNVNVGTMAIRFHHAQQSDDEALIMDLVRQFVAIHTYFSQQKVSEHNELLELKEDERRRIDMEQQRVHVQNMIMDNCMSALKHETMYYPNRIKQLADTALRDMDNFHLADIDEMMTYYKQVFDLLSTCAGKQVERMLFKRDTVSASFIVDVAKRLHKRAVQKERSLGAIREESKGKALKVMVDKTFIQVLVANIMSLYQEHRSGGDLLVNYEEDDCFVRFMFTDTAYQIADADRPNLFYVDSVRYDSRTDTLEGMQYLIAKQIIREHDKYSSHRGCRIYMKATPDGNGSSFVFTLQKA